VTHWILWTLFALVAALVGVALFFFVVTQGALKVRASRSGPGERAAHVYPVYSNPILIRIVDFQPVISAILLGQYGALVSIITERIRRMDLTGQTVLITSCAFGDVIPRVVRAATAAGARRVQMTDIVAEELAHARRKLQDATIELEYLDEDATAMTMADERVAVNVMFFLLHEIPSWQQDRVLGEAARVLAPGGVLFVADFHRPEAGALRALSWLYFKVFEPFGLALWDLGDPVRRLQSLSALQCERVTRTLGNFQVVVATKPRAP